MQMQMKYILAISFGLAIMCVLILDVWQNSKKSESFDLSTQVAMESIKKPSASNLIEDQFAIEDAEGLLNEGKLHAYDAIRASYKGQQENWFFLDIKRLLLDKQRDRAIELLSSAAFQGEQETERLVQLAALHVVEDPLKAWNYIQEALKKDPHNADLRIFSATLLESSQKKQMAVKEYILAIQKDKDNPFLREQLADLLIRQGHSLDALQILQDSLVNPSLDSIWVKAFFWSKVISPFSFPSKDSIPTGDLTPLVSYLKNLPTGVYWDEQAFAKLKESNQYLKERQETFWLRLISYLKRGDEKAALELLNHNPFQHESWAPNLENSLKTILMVRLGEKNLRIHTLDDPSDAVLQKIQFLPKLAALSELPYQDMLMALSNQLNAFIHSPEVFSVAFLAQQWNEVGIQLNRGKILEMQPEWISEAFVKAVQFNRGAANAMEMLLTLPPSPKFLMLAAQLAVDDNQKDKALSILSKIDPNDETYGYHASLMTARLYLEKNAFEASKKAINENSKLSLSTTGKELLARLALKQSDHDLALRLYTEIEQESTEAQSYLASKAFSEKDWKKAKFFTEKLLTKFPHNTLLQKKPHNYSGRISKKF